MEDTKKITSLFIAVLLLTLLFSFQGEVNAQGFCVFEGRQVFLKTKNYSLAHPSQDIEEMPDSILLHRIYDVKKDKYINLEDVIDCKQLTRINDGGNYFIDNVNTYVYSYLPHPVQFYLLSQKETTFVGRENNYMIYGKRIYYRGALIRDINDARSISFIYINSVMHDEEYEFLINGENIFIGGILVENKEDLQERLQDYNMSQKDKDVLCNEYFK